MVLDAGTGIGLQNTYYWYYISKTEPIADALLLLNILDWIECWKATYNVSESSFIFIYIKKGCFYSGLYSDYLFYMFIIHSTNNLL